MQTNTLIPVTPVVLIPWWIPVSLITKWWKEEKRRIHLVLPCTWYWRCWLSLVGWGWTECFFSSYTLLDKGSGTKWESQWRAVGKEEVACLEITQLHSRSSEVCAFPFKSLFVLATSVKLGNCKAMKSWRVHFLRKNPTHQIKWKESLSNPYFYILQQ